MARKTIIPVGSLDQRGSIPASTGSIIAKDQRLINCYPEWIDNTSTQKRTIALKKRPGFVASGVGGQAGAGFVPAAIGEWLDPNGYVPYPFVSYWNGTDSRVYLGATYVGIIANITAPYDAWCKHIDNTSIGGVGIETFSCGRGALANGTSAYYYPVTVRPTDGTPVFSSTFAGDTHTNTTIDGIASTANFYIGQLLSGTNIAAGTRIATIPGANSITTTLATTGTTGGVTITRTNLARIIDPDYPSSIATGFQTGGFVFMDGYPFIMTTLGRIYNPDLNTLWNWSASNYLTAGVLSDGGVGIARIGNNILGLGTSSIEFFYNAGNAAGSPLSQIEGASISIGVDNELGYCMVGDTLAFVSAGSVGRGIYIIEGRQATKISGNRQDAILNSYYTDPNLVANYNTHACWVLSYGIVDGQKTLLCSTEGQGIGLCYSFDTKQWWEVSASTVYKIRTISGMLIGPTTYTINKQNQNGFLQRLANGIDSTVSYKDADSASSAGAAFTMTSILDFGDMGIPTRKFCSKMDFDTDTESGTSVLSVAFTDDDFQSYQTARTIDLTAERKEITRCGSFRHRGAKFTHANDTGFRMRRIYADVTEGTN